MKKTCTDCFTDYEAKSLFESSRCPKCGSTNSMGGGSWDDLQTEKTTTQIKPKVGVAQTDKSKRIVMPIPAKKWWQFWK